MSADRPKILLADDSVTIRKVVELTFADEGIDVVSVADGDAAMIAFVADEPDLVIADVNMPGVGGYKICEIIKGEDETRHIPVILLTGSFEPFDPGEASRVGANFYFTKPFQSIRELVEKVTDLLDTNAFEPSSFPETEDIDDLYKSSFADTLKIPANETASDIQLIRIEDDDNSAEIEIKSPENGEITETFPESLTVADLGFEGMNEEVAIYSIADVPRVKTDEHDHAEVENGESAEIFPENLTVADLGFEGMDDEIPEHKLEKTDDPVESSETAEIFPEKLTVADLGYEGMDDELPAHNLERTDDDEPDEVIANEAPMTSNPFSMPVDLGDASMDDEMIETSRPDGSEPEEDIHFRDFEPPPFAAVSEGAADPFASPVTTDDTMAKYNWADETEGVIEQIPAFDPNSTLLRIEFADTEHEEVSEQPKQIEQEVEEPTPIEKKPDAISPEIIEMIAQRVIDKLSDQVVREVALEAVPRITENLIREALDHETKK